MDARSLLSEIAEVAGSKTIENNIVSSAKNLMLDLMSVSRSLM